VYIVALLIFFGELGVPTGIPAELALLIAGSYGVHSFSGLIFAIGVVVVADVSGTTTLYFVSRTGGSRLLNRVLKRFGKRSEETIGKWRSRLGGRDSVVVAVGRMLPLVRMYISIGAGLLQIRYRDFVGGAVIGALVWSGIPIALGYYFHSDVQEFADNYTTLSHLLFVILPALTLSVLIMWWVRRGHTRWLRLRRGRSATGIITASVAVVILIRALIFNTDIVTSGLTALHHSVLATWSIALAAVAVALLSVSFHDLRVAFRQRNQQGNAAHEAAQELTTTIIWLALVISAGAFIFLITSHYALF
jgi:membrane protein DedA with SNARE-associated domain